jgi:hypothetical protein
MFSLIKKGVQPIRRDPCSLCPHGDGTHASAKLPWDILDKDARTLASRKRLAAGSMLMLPDHAVEKPGGPRPPIRGGFPVIRDDSSAVAGIYCEPPGFERAAPSVPSVSPVRFPGARIEPSPGYFWPSCNYWPTPHVVQGWMPAAEAIWWLPETGAAAINWRLDICHELSLPLQVIDQEIEVELRAQPAGFALQAALPVSVVEKRVWNSWESAPVSWRPSYGRPPKQELRRHRPFYTPPPTPLPSSAPVDRLASHRLPIRATSLLAGALEPREARGLKSWIAASRIVSTRVLPALFIPSGTSLSRRRARMLQFSPAIRPWTSRDREAGGPEAVVETSRVRPIFPQAPHSIEAPARPAGSAWLAWRIGPVVLPPLRPCAAGLGPAAIFIPEIPD